MQSASGAAGKHCLGTSARTLPAPQIVSQPAATAALAGQREGLGAAHWSCCSEAMLTRPMLLHKACRLEPPGTDSQQPIRQPCSEGRALCRLAAGRLTSQGLTPSCGTVNTHSVLSGGRQNDMQGVCLLPLNGIKLLRGIARALLCPLPHVHRYTAYLFCGVLCNTVLALPNGEASGSELLSADPVQMCNVELCSSSQPRLNALQRKSEAQPRQSFRVPKDHRTCNLSSTPNHRAVTNLSPKGPESMLAVSRVSPFVCAEPGQPSITKRNKTCLKC